MFREGFWQIESGHDATGESERLGITRLCRIALIANVDANGRT